MRSSLRRVLRFMSLVRGLYTAETNSLALMTLASALLWVTFGRVWAFAPLALTCLIIICLDLPHPLVVLDSLRDLWRDSATP